MTLRLNLFGSVIDLPAIDGSVVEKEDDDSYIPTWKLTYSDPQMQTSAIVRLIGERADNILVLNSLVIKNFIFVHFDVFCSV